jgi:mannose-6-phosphate isomerase-like protein (cupin superfamily)
MPAPVKITKKPWGEERLFALTDNYAGKILIIRKGHRLSLQFHKKKEETLYLESGMLKLTIGPAKGKLSIKVLTSGNTFHIPPKVVHRMEAMDNCRLIEVSTPELKDVVRMEDDYNRTDKEYKSKTHTGSR